ncbi:TetR/AcrR family transcriptional regulator [Lutispora thermophila]|uniref:TetR/AcrR family transcriptional regulator n=1 Tax=Lutispora thermophila TaxID=288966 RepID=UPI00241DD8D4|nr:TetR/AcrR family transcriptional regulator [Lutispora thermophila]
MKEKILCAANKVIERKGLSCFTLEEVAKEAGISKGGLLYHYPSKDKLIQGLIQYYMEQFDKRFDSNRWLTSLIEENFSYDSIGSTCMTGLLAAVAMNQELLKPVKENRKELLDNVYKLKDPIMGMIICLACYGMAFSRLFCIDVFSKEDMRRIHDKLMDLSQELL